jgi:hypothetical protein
MTKDEVFSVLATDVLVVMRGDRVVRVMGNAPGMRAVILNLGDDTHTPGVQYFGALETSWDPFEMESYIEEYLERTGEKAKFAKAIGTLKDKAKKILQEGYRKVVLNEEGEILEIRLGGEGDAPAEV